MMKVTVLAVLTVLVLTTPHDGNDNNSNQAATQPNNKTHPELPYQMNDETIAIIVIVYAIAFLVIGGINIFLCVKCYNKRAVSKSIKEQMMFKRLEFATNNGLSLQQLNDPRFTQTIHL